MPSPSERLSSMRHQDQIDAKDRRIRELERQVADLQARLVKQAR